MSGSTILLYWSLGGKKWTTEKSFTPNSNSGTYGQQMFILPSGVSQSGADTFSFEVTMRGFVKGKYSGSLKAGKNEVETGDAEIEGMVSVHWEDSLLLTTTDGIPYCSFNGYNAWFIPRPRIRMGRQWGTS